MLKKENLESKMRCAMSKMFTEKDVSLHTQAIMTECMDGKTEKEKEKLASQLLTIISECNSEDEMLIKAQQLVEG